MSWLWRYRMRERIDSSLWITPAIAVPVAMLFAALVRSLDSGEPWVLLGMGPDGARALLAAFVGATLSFVVFVYSILLLAVQLSSAQMSPRVIGAVLRDRPTKVALAIFLFSFVHDVGAMARVDERVFELSVLVASVLTGSSVFAFLYLVDHVARSRRRAGAAGRTCELRLAPGTASR